MTKKSRIKDGIYTVGFMFVATLISVSAVSGLHLATLSMVERNNQLFTQKAILRAARIPLPDEAQAIAALYSERVTPADATGRNFKVNADKPTLALVRSGPGLWGQVTAVVCFEPLTLNLVGVTFTEHSETPGLGARIEETWFQEQFNGRSGELKLQPEGTRSAKPDEIDGITGATVTSKAVRDIVNGTLREAGSSSAQGAD